MWDLINFEGHKKTKDVLEIVLECIIQDDVCRSHRRIMDTEDMFLSYKKKLVLNVVLVELNPFMTF